MSRNATLDRRRTRTERVEYRQNVRDRLMREAFRGLQVAAGRVVSPVQYEVQRSDPTRAATPWAGVMDVLAENLAYARTLPAAERHQVKLAVRRVIETMDALVTADDLAHDACPMTLALAETRQQEIADEAQLRYVADPDSPANAERLIAAGLGHKLALREVVTLAAFRLARTNARAAVRR